jgi:hypothetical protein
LNGLNLRDCHLAGEIGVFPEILKVAAILRNADDIYAGSFDEMFTAVGCLLAGNFAEAGGQIAVPGCGKR